MSECEHQEIFQIAELGPVKFAPHCTGQDCGMEKTDSKRVASKLLQL